jgi:hypothetical protein
VVSSPFCGDKGVAMTEVYKFLPSKFAEHFLSGASIRVGTLGDFRNEENHHKQIGDATEGRSIGLVPFAQLGHSGENPLLRSRLKHGGLNFGNSRNVTIQNVTMVKSVPDYYLMSFSRVCNDQCWKEFASYDVALHIADIDLFAKAILKSLDDRVTGSHLSSSVEYKDISFDLTKNAWQSPSPFVKDRKTFAGQNEYRVLFKPSSTPISPVTVACNFPADLVRIFAKRPGL